MLIHKKQRSKNRVHISLTKGVVTTSNESSTNCRQLKVYVFGNQDVDFDNTPFTVTKRIGDSFPEVMFVVIKPNEDLPFADGQDAIIMDAVEGLKEVTRIQNEDLTKIILPPRSTAHDFDLGFQLKYLTKLGKLGKITLIGLPMDEPINYTRIHSIFKKLVAQDMQGS